MLLDVVLHHYHPALVTAPDTVVGITQDEAASIRAGLLSCESTAVEAHHSCQCAWWMLAEYSVTCMVYPRRPTLHAQCRSDD